MIRTVIIDDEPLARRRLRDLLSEEEDLEVVGEFGDGEAAQRDLVSLDPDVLFIDVQMPGLSGLDLLEFVHASVDSDPATVLVTAHDEYAVRAFEEGVVDYLVKPFDSVRFGKTLRRIREWLPSPAKGRKTETTHAPERLAVKTRGGIRVLRFEEIDWIESSGNYIRLHAGREGFLFRETIQHFEQMRGAGNFVRINRSTIVNVDRIVLLQPSFNRDHLVMLRDGTRLTLNRAYRAKLEPYVFGLA